MKKISTVYLLSAIVLFGSCAREYATFKQMPTSAYQGQKAKTMEQPATETTNAEVTAAEQPAAEVANFEALSANPEVVKMLASNTPKQLDEQLETALASAQGLKLMATPLIASRIGKARAMLARIETKQVDVAAVAGSSVVSKMVDKQLSKNMAPAAAKAIDGKVTAGLILVLVGIILGAIPAVGWLVGGIVTAIGVVFIVLGLLD